MTVMTRRCPSLLCAALLIAQIPAAAQGPPPQLPPPAMRPPPESAQEFSRTLPWDTRAAEAGPVRRLGARDVVALAMVHNLDIVIERYNQQVAAQRVVAARGAYDPSISMNTVLTSVTNPLTGAAGAAAIPTEHLDIASLSPGLRQLLPGGATATVSAASTRTRTSSTSPVLNPVVATSLTAAVTQPLLRGFLATPADRQIDLARLDAELTASLYRQRLTSIVQQVLALYWELQYAIRVHDTRRQSKDLAIVQYDATRMRVQNGLLPPVALTAARAEIASRERDVLQAEVQIIGAENGLKLLISQDPASSIWSEALLPVDDPAAEPAVPTYREALDRATAGRPELEQLRLQLEQNAVDRRFFRRETLPTVNLTASLTSSGRSGVALLKVNGLGTEDPTEAVYQQATLVRGRLDTQRTKLLQAVMVDVRNALQVISTQRKSLEAARLTTQLFAEQLEGQTARYTAGFSNDFELRRYQRDLVDARVKELRALVDLQLAVIALQRATDTLLEASGAAGAPLTPPTAAPAPR